MGRPPPKPRFSLVDSKPRPKSDDTLPAIKPALTLNPDVMVPTIASLLHHIDRRRQLDSRLGHKKLPKDKSRRRGSL